MLGKFSNFFGNKSYATQKKIAESGKIHERLKLAKSKNTHPEILYYLAEHDDDPAVRRSVVGNMATPIQASSILVRDPDVDIRVALADRLVKLWPDIGDKAHSQIYAFAVQSLGVLALDEVLKIRIALSSTLKDFANAPPKVVSMLAQDVERQVSEPILRYCIAIPDEDLIEILQNHPEDWVLEAIAGRSEVSAPISEIIIDHENISAGQILLENDGAELSEHVLKYIIDKAKKIQEWQKLIARRKELPAHLAKDLATFVEYSIREILIQRSDFDKETIQEISEAFKRRFDMVDPIADGSKKEALPSSNKEDAVQPDKDQRVRDAIAVRDKPLVVEIMATETGLSHEKIDTVLGHKSAKSIVALCWKGGFSMRTALALQKDFVKVPVKSLIYPRGGSEYPLTEDEIKWQLDFLGIKS